MEGLNHEEQRLFQTERTRMTFHTLSAGFIVVFLLFAADPLHSAQEPVSYCDCILEDEEGDRIRFPSSVFVEPVTKEVFITDGRNRVVVYTPDFFPIYTLDKKYGVESPQGVNVDHQGNLYIVQSATKENPKHRISVFNACFKWIKDIYLTGFEGENSFIPTGLSTDKKGNILVAGSSFPGVLLLDEEGKLIEILSPEDGDQKVRINNVSVDKNGRIYLVSEEKGRIYVYDENRKFLFNFGDKGGSSGKLSRPQAAAIDAESGTIYVVDYMRHTVSAYDGEGKYLFEFGGLGWGEGWFQYPRDITVDNTGRILVADTFNDRIEVFKTNEEQNGHDYTEKKQ
ncbi:MAG: NHL repeat-containing protein [Nitrospirota bacterium]